jgi:hypothetical protein
MHVNAGYAAQQRSSPPAGPSGQGQYGAAAGHGEYGAIPQQAYGDPRQNDMNYQLQFIEQFQQQQDRQQRQPLQQGYPNHVAHPFEQQKPDIQRYAGTLLQLIATLFVHHGTEQKLWNRTTACHVCNTSSTSSPCY